MQTLKPRPRKRRGVMLVEIMIVVVIISILGNIARASFTNQTRKAKRVQAFVALNAVYKGQLAYKASNDVFAADFSTLGGYFTAQGMRVLGTNSVQVGIYTLSMTAGDANSWECQASGNLDNDVWQDVVVSAYNRP